MEEYISGSSQLPDVITAQINLCATKNALNSIESRVVLSTVGLVKALGGGWHKDDLKKLVR